MAEMQNDDASGVINKLASCALESKDDERSKKHLFLRKLLNKTCKIKISDGRTLIGSFLCTDKDMNVILGQCQEFVKPDGPEGGEEARTLGLAMVPGRHIVSIDVDTNIQEFRTLEHPLGCINLPNKV